MLLGGSKEGTQARQIPLIFPMKGNSRRMQNLFLHKDCNCLILLSLQRVWLFFIIQKWEVSINETPSG